ncbi:MAG: PBP1A family penicillin-binding protein [Bryobacterales bacterium]|nr:PBP1A family penicillin-binding protein [Bryobacterales bacterium]
MNRARSILAHPVGRTLAGLTLLAGAVSLGVFLYYYNYYATMIEEKLVKGPYSNTSKLFAAPHGITLGDEISPDDVIESLHRAGYSPTRTNRMGYYRQGADSVEVFPGPDSYFQQEAHVVRFGGRKVRQIVSLRDNTERTQFWLEPELITNLFDRNREKRRILKFNDIPLMVRNAVLSAEDKRFFQHAGFDPIRILKSAWVDLKAGRNKQGASTLSMQLARELWLTKERNWRRKVPEVLITIHLERKLTKEEIFEHYANQIYLGRVGSFNIHGFGEGAQAYFSKDIRQLTLAESALLAGIIQGPSVYNPFRNPERARTRRNLILGLMRDNGYINQEQWKAACDSPLRVAQGSTESDDAPYFVDLINDQLQNNFQDHDFQANSYRVYTSLDLNLQRAASEAMRAGLKEVDAIMERRKRTPAKGWPQVQAALVAVDPRTGEVKALVGGRDYGQSQLNRTLAKRQPGSVFKPFVYAAALSSAVDGDSNALTPLSTVVDEPTTFYFENQVYEPNNFKGEFFGTVTMRQALAKSLNIPTVKFAEQVGYNKVSALARRAGLQVRATPALALGAYDARPIDIAGAYTIFANRGQFTEANWIKTIRDQDGASIYVHKPVQRAALDARVAYMMTNLMGEVLRSGTGAGVRARGFGLPAAGKTGTSNDSHDGWFAGFTTELICVVWVGYDDNRALDLEGSKSALPIWVDFMKRAHRFRPYRRATEFPAPDGVVAVEIDSSSGKLASGGGCGSPTRTEVFLVGTQPIEYCGGSQTQVASWESGPQENEPPRLSDQQPRRVASRRVDSIPVDPQPVAGSPKGEDTRKKGFFSRILDVFK